MFFQEAFKIVFNFVLSLCSYFVIIIMQLIIIADLA